MRKLIIAICLVALTAIAGDILVVGSKMVVNSVDWTPADLDSADLVGWYDASDVSTITTNASGDVSQWDDKSGNGYYMEQLSGGLQLEYLTNAINGLPVLYGSGTFDRMYSTNMSITVTNFALVSVGASTAGSDFLCLGGIRSDGLTGSGSSSNWFVLRQQVRDGDGRLSTIVEFDDIAYSISSAWDAKFARPSPMIASARYDGELAYARMDGGVLANTSNPPDGWVFPANEIRVGRDSGTPRPYQGELLFLATSDSNLIDRAEGYLAHKWGITLDASHPYFAVAPKVFDTKGIEL